MYNSEERVNEVFIRMNKFNEKKVSKLKKIVIMQGICLFFFGFIFVFDLMFFEMGNLVLTEHIVSGTSASIFANSAYLPYIIVGISSFVLGVICTLICVWAHKETINGERNER